MNHKKLTPSLPRGRADRAAPTWPQAANGTRKPMTIPQAANQRWSLDSSPTYCPGAAVRVLAIVDDFTREALALVVDSSSAASGVVPWNGATGRTCGAEDRAGKPSENDSQASSAGSATSALNEEVFASLTEACAVIERWRLDYNQVRPTRLTAA